MKQFSCLFYVTLALGLVLGEGLFEGSAYLRVQLFQFNFDSCLRTAKGLFLVKFVVTPVSTSFFSVPIRKMRYLQIHKAPKSPWWLIRGVGLIGKTEFLGGGLFEGGRIWRKVGAYSRIYGMYTVLF